MLLLCLDTATPQVGVAIGEARRGVELLVHGQRSADVGLGLGQLAPRLQQVGQIVQAAGQVGHEHHPQPRQPVHGHAADEQEDHHRRVRKDQHGAHGGGRAGRLEHPPGQGHAVEAVAQARDGLARPQPGERAVAEGADERHAAVARVIA